MAPGPPRGRTVLLLLAALLALSACTETITYYSASARELHGKRVLLLHTSLLPPTSRELHERVVKRIEAAVTALPEIGEVLGEPAIHASGVSLTTQDAYDEFSNTLSLTGVSDPELSYRLFTGLGVDLLALAQPAYLPCPACDQGDELWVVGQLVDARTGRLLFRAHMRTQQMSKATEAIDAEADTLTQQYLEAFRLAFTLRPHIERFEHLRPR